MFHLKFKHTWHLKWNRSESMHQTFSKGSLNLCKQKLILFFMALYLLKLISPDKSQEYASDEACLTPWGRQLLPRDPHSHPDKGSVPFPHFTSVVIPHPSWRPKGKQTTSSSCKWVISPLNQASTAAQRHPLGRSPPTSDSAERKAAFMVLVSQCF